MNGFTKYVLLRSETDNHIKAVVDKSSYPDAVAVTVQSFDLQEFNNNPYVYTVKDGTYKKDMEEDAFRKNLEKSISDLSEKNLNLTQQNRDLNNTISQLMEQIATLQLGGIK